MRKRFADHSDSFGTHAETAEPFRLAGGGGLR